MMSLKDYSEFEVIDGNILKNFMAENFVMNYSNIELQRILFQQSNNKNGKNGGMMGAPSPIVPPQFRKHSYSVMSNNNKMVSQSQMVGGGQMNPDALN